MISKRKQEYKLNVIKLQDRINQLEEIICPYNHHEYIEINRDVLPDYCGGFVDFKYIENEDDVEDYRFECYDISNGYGSNDFDGMTLLEILKKVHGQVAFELNQIDW